MKKNLLIMMEDNVPSKMTSSKNHQPWITTETKRSLRRKHRWFKKMKNCPSEKNVKKYKDLKRSSQRLCRQAHENYVNDLICEDSNNKKLFSYVRGKRKDDVGISDLCDGEKVIQDPLTKANMFNEQFSSVFSTPGTPTPRTANSSFPPMPNIKVSRNGVLTLMLDIKENKATGPDGIPGKLLKICAHELADSFTTKNL